MKNWREIRQDIKEAMEDALYACKVKYYKPKDGDFAYFKVEIEDLLITETEVESALEEVMEHHVLEPEWEREGEVNLIAYWDDGECEL